MANRKRTKTETDADTETRELSFAQIPPSLQSQYAQEIADLPVTVKGDANLAELADGRKRTTIRDWVLNGAPHTMDGRFRIFELAEVIRWCHERGIDFFNKDQKPLTPIQNAKLRQEVHKANDLEFKEQLRNGQYGLIADFEKTTEELLVQIRILMVDIHEKTKRAAGVSGSKAERLDALLVEGFNRIAKMDLDES